MALMAFCVDEDGGNVQKQRSDYATRTRCEMEIQIGYL
jgi:hypothetical protein